MKRLAYAAVCACILLVLAGCSERPVDESVLPTRVPTLDPNTFAVAAVPVAPEPTATPAPTPAPTSAPTPAPTATPLPPATPVPPTPAPTPVAATAAVTATTALTPAVASASDITATAAVTVTGAVTGAAEPATAATELPPGIVAALAQIDPMRGQMLTLSSGCIGCHSLDPNQVMPGPTWRNIGNVAATRVPGESAELYLYNSIIHPNAYLVEGFLPNIMLQIYQDTLSEQAQADLIAYLLTLKN
jgi:cytochrome c551/c552